MLLIINMRWPSLFSWDIGINLINVAEIILYPVYDIKCTIHHRLLIQVSLGVWEDSGGSIPAASSQRC